MPQVDAVRDLSDVNHRGKVQQPIQKGKLRISTEDEANGAKNRHQGARQRKVLFFKLHQEGHQEKQGSPQLEQSEYCRLSHQHLGNDAFLLSTEEVEDNSSRQFPKSSRKEVERVVRQSQDLGSSIY